MDYNPWFEKQVMLGNIEFREQWDAVPNCSHVNLGQVVNFGSFYYLNISKGYKELRSQRGPFQVSSNDLILFGLPVQNDSCRRGTIKYLSYTYSAKYPM